MATFPPYAAPTITDPLGLGRRRKSSLPTGTLPGLLDSFSTSRQDAMQNAGLLTGDPNLPYVSPRVPAAAPAPWNDTDGLLAQRDTVTPDVIGYVSGLPNAVKPLDIRGLLDGLQQMPAPPQLASLPTRDRTGEARDTLKGAGILGLLGLVTGNRDVLPGAIGGFLGNAGQAYDQRAAEDLQRAQMEQQQALQGYNLQRQSVGDANDIVTQRANAALKQYGIDQDAFNDAQTRRDRAFQNQQVNALKRDDMERKAAADKARDSARRIGTLFSFASRSGGRLTPESEAALSQAIRDAGGAENLPADFIAQLSDKEKETIRLKDAAIKAQYYGIDQRTATQAAGQAETARHNSAMEALGAARNVIAGNREDRLGADGAAGNGKIEGFTPIQVETQRRQTQSELDKLVAQKRSFGQYADQARQALATGTVTDKNGQPRQLTAQERATYQQAIDQAHQLLPDIDNRIQGARGRLQDWNNRQQQLQRANRVGSDDGTPTDPSDLEQFIGKSTGKLGCARAVCQIMKGIGIPVPQTESAGDMEASLRRGVKNGAWVEVPIGQSKAGDVVVSSGTGPSGRHVTVATGDGRTIGNPGSRSNFKIAYSRLPTGDGSATAFRYVGPAGGANGSPAVAQNNVTPKPVPNGSRPAQHRQATGQYAPTPRKSLSQMSTAERSKLSNDELFDIMRGGK